MILNPSNKALYASFKITLKRWIESIAPKGIVVKSILFNTHHMYDMVEFFHVIDKMEFTSFLQDDATNISIVILTTHNKRGSYSVERSKLVVVFKHFVQCKGNSKGYCLLL